jgi:hypothetical protein
MATKATKARLTVAQVKPVWFKTMILLATRRWTVVQFTQAARLTSRAGL